MDANNTFRSIKAANEILVGLTKGVIMVAAVVTATARAISAALKYK